MQSAIISHFIQQKRANLTYSIVLQCLANLPLQQFQQFVVQQLSIDLSNAKRRPRPFSSSYPVPNTKADISKISEREREARRSGSARGLFLGAILLFCCFALSPSFQKARLCGCKIGGGHYRGSIWYQ
jgi:hypothetical protein